jgi:hypothetical protein
MSNVHARVRDRDRMSGVDTDYHRSVKLWAGQGSQ